MAYAAQVRAPGKDGRSNRAAAPSEGSIERIAPGWTRHRLGHAPCADPMNPGECKSITALDVLTKDWQKYAVRRLESGRAQHWRKRLDGIA